jgi:hypothetical protein
VQRHGHPPHGPRARIELAKSGQCATVEEIKKKLKAESLSDKQLMGKTLIKQLRELIEAAEKRAQKE